MKLLLFDVDLTLVNSGGSGRRAMTQAFATLFNRSNGFDSVDFAGRTDPLILKDALAGNGLQWSPEKEENFKETYFNLLKTEIEKPHAGKKIEPGIPEVLQALSAKEDILLGLLTGNWKQGAQIKLAYFGILSHFKMGVFADDSENREALPHLAVQRCQEEFSTSFPPENVYVVGDTPLDVACARPLGAKSVAVATGFFSFDQLADSNPDYLFRDLSNYAEFLKIIEA